MKPCRLHILGASGTGTTTLASSVASTWSVPHADSDDYYWTPSTPPYVTPRPIAERAELMRSVFMPRPAWVLSGSMMGWGDSVAEECDAIVFLTLGHEERMVRLRSRQEARSLAHGSDPEADEAFFAWADSYEDPSFDGRNRVRHEDWLAQRPQPLLRLDSSQPVEALTASVLAWEPHSTT